MIKIALETMPDAVSLVPESPNEITTEGGLDVINNFENVKNAVEKLKAMREFSSAYLLTPTSNRSKPPEESVLNRSNSAQANTPNSHFLQEPPTAKVQRKPKPKSKE